MKDVIGDRTLRDLLNEKAIMHPDKTMLLYEDTDEQQYIFTYRQFLERANRLSHVFSELGVEKGDKVTLHLPNCPDFMVAWFALANIGAVMVPTNILSTADEMKYILAHSESVLLITEEVYLSKFNRIRKDLPLLQDILLSRYEETIHRRKSLGWLIEQSEATLPAISIQPEDTAAILYTSGTTSLPKGVLVTHANYIYAGEVMSKSIRLSPDDRQLIVLPLFHGNAQYYSSMSALTVGASIAITEKFSASRYFKQAKRLEATVGSLFAGPIRMILNKKYDEADADNKLRLIWFAQAITERELNQFEQKYGAKLLQLYGMTETIGTPLMNPLDGIHKSTGIGRPTLGYQVKIVDEFDSEVQPGNSGQLLVKGEPGRTIMKGYFNNKKATEETIRNGWLYTEDNVREDKDGYFFFVDRKKDMIKRAGENVATNEIEKVIADHPSVFESAVIGIPDEIRDEAIKVYVILQEGEQVSENDLLAYCEEKMAKFKVPSYIEFVEAFPRTSVGKIQKHILRKWHEER